MTSANNPLADVKPGYKAESGLIQFLFSILITCISHSIIDTAFPGFVSNTNSS